MKTKWLFPYDWRPLGWLLTVPCAILGLATLHLDFKFDWLDVRFLADGNNLTNEVAGLGLIAGLMLIAFSKEKIEDEMISLLRLEALQWSVYTNYLVLALAMVLFYDLAFFQVLVYNMFTILLVFIGRFRWLLRQQTKIPLL